MIILNSLLILIVTSLIEISLSVISLIYHSISASETWHLVSQGGTFDCPPPRHRHSAVLHDNAMWIFGGMTDLQERSDFWRFDFGQI
jgi:hypothetical protein